MGQEPESEGDEPGRRERTRRLLVALGSVLVGVTTIGGAIVLTPGLPDCPPYGRFSCLFAPWLWEATINALLIFGVFVVVLLPIRICISLLQAAREG